MATLEDALSEAKRNNRVCPQPRKWQELYELLPSKRRVGNGWEPSLPFILAAWDMPALPKMLRFREHLEGAAAHGNIEQVHAFICSLPESEWRHIGE